MTARINELFARIRSKLGMSMPPTLIVSVITPWAESETGNATRCLSKDNAWDVAKTRDGDSHTLAV